LSGLGASDPALATADPTPSAAEPEAPTITATTEAPPADEPSLTTDPIAASLFSGVPMDLDFDDEDGYSDDDYDAEVFEDEMDEEMNRPRERIVNMSVAPGEHHHVPLQCEMTLTEIQTVSGSRPKLPKAQGSPRRTKLLRRLPRLLESQRPIRRDLARTPVPSKPSRPTST
jgi:hypothetical protein